jgi:hypothetical protein
MWFLSCIVLLPILIFSTENILLNGAQYPANSVKKVALTLLQLSREYALKPGTYSSLTQKNALDNLIKGALSKKIKHPGEEERNLLVACGLIGEQSKINQYNIAQIVRDFIKERYDRRTKDFKLHISDISVGLDKGRYAFLITGNIFPELLIKNGVFLIQNIQNNKEADVLFHLRYAASTTQSIPPKTITAFQMAGLFDKDKQPFEHIKALLKHYNFYAESKKTTWDTAIFYFEIP